ncbi:MAG: NAD-dependent succinate-semialdehyde dehydrogenase [Gemmatimonadaceae bacterium]
MEAESLLSFLMTIATINPATGETLRTFPSLSEGEVESAVSRAASAARVWGRLAIADRAGVVARAAALLDSRRDEYARLMTLEMGKLLSAGVEEITKCAATCRYYADRGPALLADDAIEGGPNGGRVLFQPLGVVLAVMPWNFPFWQVIRFAAPALVAGNVGILKHASNVPQCAQAIEQIFRDAGAPSGVFQSLLIDAGPVARILADPRVAAVTLTGSEGAGRAVGSSAGQHLKKSVLELGGSDPFLVMPSADLHRAATVAVGARTINGGQSCIAAKRFIVHDQIAREFEQRFVTGMARLKVGDPMLADTQLGPMATPQIVLDLERQIKESVAQGARVLTGGKRITGPGNFFQPTVLVDVPPDAPAAREELFGPVAALFRARDVDHAIELANTSRFGLAASAWTNDPGEIDRFSVEIDVGTVFINGMVASDPRFPFGGVKASGYGRELGSFGLREFVNVKTVRFGAAASRTE